MTRLTPLMLAVAIGLGLPANQMALAAGSLPSTQRTVDGRHVYIVVFDEPAVASFRGFNASDKHRPKLAATSPSATGETRLDVKSEAALAYREYLMDLRRMRLNDASSRLGRRLEPEFTYEYALNGMAVALTDREAVVLASLNGIARVQRERVERPLTDRGPTWIKAPEVWSGAATGTPKRGEGIVVGIVDTGINPNHQSFAATGPRDGYVHSNPKGSFLGNSVLTKNNKLIGIWDLTTGTGDNETNDGSDLDGHGTHVAGTAAGNTIAFSLATTPVYSGDLSGVAPRANIVSYKACEEESSCRGAWTMAAINQAVADQVDVINYSIGGSAVDPWRVVGDEINDSAEAMLAAREAGIVVAAAAGNDGPNPGTHSSPANSPWVLGVAAATHDRAQVNVLGGLAGGNTTPPSGGILVGAGNSNGTSALGLRSIVEATDYPLCASGNNLNSDNTPSEWATQTRFANQIVVCRRGTYSRLSKSANIRVGCFNSPGSCGMVLVNQQADGLSTVSDPHSVPTVHLSYANGEALLAWLRSGTGHVGRLEGSTFSALASNGDQLASFSGRGPVTPLGVLKPDVTAPGVSIYAASRSNNTGVVSMSGTSMASPHVAGSAALVKSANPTWSATQIISALTLTARSSVVLPSGAAATPHDQGAGTVDLSKAVKAGLYLDVTGAQFRSANQFNTNALNLPSVGASSCFDSCTLSRTFRLMPGVASGQYSVEFEMPAGTSASANVNSFSLSDSNSQTLNLTFNVGAKAGNWVYGSVILRNTSGDGRPDLKLPVAVFSDPGAVPASITRTVSTERGAFDVDLSGLVGFSNARFIATDLVAPRTDTPTLAQDPTNGDAYDGLTTGIFWYAGTIPASPQSGAVDYRLAVTTTSAAPDADLFVGLDANGDGTPDEAEEQCTSLSSASAESCTLTVRTTSSPQTYWVLVQMFNSGGSSQSVTVESSAIGLAAGSGSMVATGPGSTAKEQAFKVRLGYDDPTFLNGQRRVGYLMLQPTQGSTAAYVPVTLTRSGSSFAPFTLADDVARSVTLPAGAAHDLLYFDVPPHATSVTFTTTSDANIDLYVARVANDNHSSASTIAAAPARNLANASQTTGSGNETITLTGGALPSGRWYVTPVNPTGAAVTATVKARINTAAARPGFRSGHYFNPSRSGHGAFIDFAGPQGNPDQWLMVWYTYLGDGTPTWYYAQGASPGAAGVWRANLLRVVWNGSSASATDVGDVSLTEVSSEGVVFSYNIDGVSGSERLARLGAGGGCPTYNSQPLDISGHWYSPSQSGFGYSYQVTAGGSPQEIFVSYVYDGNGFPRWLYGQRNFDPNSNTIPLSWFQGFCPSCSAAPLTANNAGTGTRVLATGSISDMSVNTTFAGQLSGTWTQSRPVARLSQSTSCQ